MLLLFLTVEFTVPAEVFAAVEALFTAGTAAVGAGRYKVLTPNGVGIRAAPEESASRSYGPEHNDVVEVSTIFDVHFPCEARLMHCTATCQPHSAPQTDLLTSLPLLP